MRYLPAALILLTVAVAQAQASLPERDVRVSWERGAPKVSFSARDLADERVQQDLASGLRKRLVVTVSAHLKGSNWQMTVRQFACDVTHDLWEDGYLVRFGNQTEQIKTLQQVLDRCLVVQGLYVGEPRSYERHRGKDMYFVVSAEFNPISKKECAELIRPTSGGDPIGPITVSIVRRRICRADRTVEFRSAFVKVPP